MSRRTVALPDGGELTAGWDVPLNTFFAVVLNDPDDDIPVLWVGTSRSEILTLDGLYRALGPYAHHIEPFERDLEDDRVWQNSRRANQAKPIASDQEESSADDEDRSR
jgi:hypothetical protein